MASIVRLVSREFFILLAVATALAAGLGFFLFDSLLQSIYAYYAFLDLLAVTLKLKNLSDIW